MKAGVRGSLEVVHGHGDNGTAQVLLDQIVKLEAELKKKYGDKAPPSVLSGKSVPVSQPVGKKKGKRNKA